MTHDPFADLTEEQKSNIRWAIGTAYEHVADEYHAQILRNLYTVLAGSGLFQDITEFYRRRER